MSYESKIRIEVTNDVHRALRELKQGGETFNDVLRRLLELDTVDKQKDLDAKLDAQAIRLKEQFEAPFDDPITYPYGKPD